MTKKGNLNLQQLAARYSISDLFESSLAYYSSSEGGEHDLRAYDNRISCYELQLIRMGVATVKIGDKTLSLNPGDLMVITPYQPIDCFFPEGLVSEGLLVEQTFYNSACNVSQESDATLSGVPTTINMVYHLDQEQVQELSGIFQQIRAAIRQKHFYKHEMLRSLFHVCLLFLNELPYDKKILTHDFHHKENVFRIFVHLASNNFRKQRSLMFYADKLNMTTTYLSRIVKEISGNTIGDYLSLLTYNEACRLLRNTDMTIGEISDELSFNDQSAFTNFFKLHSSMSPNAYRHNKIKKG
ncbi:MAG: helix-turn-helix domain-containing protein [Prevotella sp.]|jgi:AraC-like DNA-binding protein